MIKAMIVDDEYVVRKGLMHIVPWRDYDIELVGEASNGQKALEQLADRPVDLIVTDLTMPVMDGFQLIRQVKQRYPAIRTVVLTCHQDFHQVQEALRLGAIDYIVKTELENDKLTKSIERIVERLREEAERVGGAAAKGPEPTAEVPAAPWALFLVPIHWGEEAALPDLVAVDGDEGRAVSVDGVGWCLRSADLREDCRTPELACAAVDLERWVPVVIRDVRNVKEKRLIQLLDAYRRTGLFYDYRDGQAVYELSWSRLETPAAADSSAAEALRQRLRSFHWVHEDREFAALLSQTTEVRPLAPAWTRLLRDVLYAWKHFTVIPAAAEWHVRAERLLYWEQWAEYLQEVRTSLRHGELSGDVCVGILRAMFLASEELETGINQTEVARRVNLNRSYFSRCFKQYVGKHFQDFMNDLRVDRATRLLEQTNEPIYRIAEKAGFQDEKYFSKFYKQQTGMLPKEVR